MAVISDDQLLRACQGGDVDSFEVLFDRHRQQIYRAINSRVRDHLLAEDLTQETFVRMLLHINQVRSGTSLQAWLHRVATNLCLSEWRKVRPSLSSTEDIQDRLADHRPSPYQVVAGAEAAAILSLALERINPRYQTVIRLRLFEECEYPEIATRMNVTEAHAQVVYYRARCRLVTEYRRLITERTHADVCPEAIRIPAMLEGRLAREREWLEFHAERCPTCSQVAEDWRGALIPA